MKELMKTNSACLVIAGHAPNEKERKKDAGI